MLTDAYLAGRTVSPQFSERLMRILLEGLGILRDRETMEKALADLDCLAAGPLTDMERKRLRLGRGMLLAALARKESRGSHTRSDHPARDDKNFRRITEVYRRSSSGEELAVEFLEIPEREERGKHAD